jgi:hypothetical protein
VYVKIGVVLEKLSPDSFSQIVIEEGFSLTSFPATFGEQIYVLENNVTAPINIGPLEPLSLQTLRQDIAGIFEKRCGLRRGKI